MQAFPFIWVYRAHLCEILSRKKIHAVLAMLKIVVQECDVIEG